MEKERRNRRQQHRRADDRRGVIAGELGDQPFRVGLFLGGSLHQGQDTRHGGLLVGALGADLQHTAQVHAAGDHLHPRAHVRRHGLAGDLGGIQRAFPLHDNAVHRDPFPWPYQQDVPHGHLLRQRGDLLAVTQNHGKVRAQVHQAGNGAAGPLHRDLLKQLSHLEKQHDRRGLFPILHGKGADRCQGHEEFFVKNLPPQDVAQGRPQNIVAAHQPRAHHKACLPPAVQEQTGGKERRAHHDAQQQPFLPARHASTSQSGSTLRMHFLICFSASSSSTPSA